MLSLIAMCGGLAAGALAPLAMPGAGAAGTPLVTQVYDVGAIVAADLAAAGLKGAEAHPAKLMRLIEAMVRPYSWRSAGGAGSLQHFAVGQVLVVQAVPDVQGEVAALLESLRRLEPARELAPAPRPAEAATLVAEYKRACAAGDPDKAARLAVRALALDPACFCGGPGR